MDFTEKITAFRLTPVLPPWTWSRPRFQRHADATRCHSSCPRAAHCSATLAASAMRSSSARWTGGPSIALSEVLPALPGDFPVPILIVPHVPPQYAQSLANRLNQRSEIEVVEGTEGMAVAAGFAYIAPGGRHMRVEHRAGRIVIAITSDPPENSCRPAADYLFSFRRRGIWRQADGRNHDRHGARWHGRLSRDQAPRWPRDDPRRRRLRQVFGMPKAVADAQLSDEILPLRAHCRRTDTARQWAAGDPQDS